MSRKRIGLRYGEQVSVRLVTPSYDEHYKHRNLDVSCSEGIDGAGFQPVKKVTDGSSARPHGSFIGDCIGVAAGPDSRPAVVWADFRKGDAEIYFGRP